MERINRSGIFFFLLTRCALAQSPAGSIVGIVSDPSGSTVGDAHVTVRSISTGLARSIATSGIGDFTVAVLPAGEYQVSVEALGFQRAARDAWVQAGETTIADFTLTVGDVKDSITVDTATPLIQYDSHTVAAVITQSQIQDIPLNGRNFLELAKLQPGVQPPSASNNNRVFVPILGAPGGNTGSGGRGTRVSVDGGSIMAVGSFGAQMGFSQEVVQEFQISAANFDLSTGTTDAGAINVVTRSGGNDFHGTAFYFFRDHTLSAYPALARDPTNPDPFFQRRQFGWALGGPVRHARVFFFANWESNEQRGVVDSNLLDPDFAHFSRITTSPLFGDQFSVRLDARLTIRQTGFIRYSHDGGRAFAPSPSTGNPMAYPSQWTRQSAWSDQSLVGITSVFVPALVNDLRFSYFFSSTGETAPANQLCPGCLGIGLPAINIQQSNLFIGNSASNSNLGRRLDLNDVLTWQHSSHRVRFGAEWEYNRGGILAWPNEPATLTLWSPSQARQYGLPLPASFRSVDEILQLPLQNVAVSVGDARVPQQGGGNVRHWPAARLFVQDSWRVRHGLNVNYGLGWEIDRDLNYDLPKPPLLAPLLGAGGLGPPQRSWTNFSPVLGLAWSPMLKTVIRAGAGLYYEPLTSPGLDAERAALGPPGLGRQTFPGSSLHNTLPGIPGVLVGASLDFRNKPTLFTGADLLTILSGQRSGLVQGLANADQTIQAIQLTKQLTGTGVFPSDYKTSSALHTSVGVQRQIARDFVLSADFVYRHFVHLTLGNAVDLNHYNSFFNGAPNPVIPVCTGVQKDDPKAMCSTGPIDVQEWQGRATYKGLLLRADKRFSHGFQVLTSYAYSSNTGTNNGNGFNLYNWLQNAGPLPNDFIQILNIAAVTQLPRRVELGLNFSYSSAPPFSAYIGGIDLNGDGTQGDLLPGTTVDAFNRSMGRSDLEQLVAQFDSSHAGTKDAAGRPIPPLALPVHYSFGDNFHSLDLRLTRSFVFQERWRLSVIGEAFNLYNKANLNGYSGDLTSAAFGQPTSRATQVFGSGGPRAFQLALRVSF
jgi:Carboxypeptidase regulatory-like domain